MCSDQSINRFPVKVKDFQGPPVVPHLELMCGQFEAKNRFLQHKCICVNQVSRLKDVSDICSLQKAQKKLFAWLLV